MAMRELFIWKFLGNVLWREVGNVTRTLQLIAVTTPALLVIIIGLFGGQWSKDYWPAWVWAIIAGAAILMVFFIGFARRTYALEKAQEPKVAISEPIEDHIPWNVDPLEKAKRRHWSIEIENISNSIIARCSVTELKFVNIYGRVAPEAGRYFRLRSERSASKPHHTYERFFDLRGLGAKVGIDICATDERDLSKGILMTYATSPTGTAKDLIHPRVFPHWLTIRLTADNLPQPTDRTFKIFISDDGRLRMETAKDEPPPPTWITAPTFERERSEVFTEIGDSGPIRPLTSEPPKID